VWVCFGVGVHFFQLASSLQNPTLRPLGVLLIAVAAAALVTGLVTAVAPSTVTGVGAGLSLLAFGLATLLADGRARSDPSPQA
jgi:formiminotetrahydrofolate cyclodeaminase